MSVIASLLVNYLVTLSTHSSSTCVVGKHKVLTAICQVITASMREFSKYVLGAANKSNPLPCFVNISTTNRNFYKEIYTTICHSYLHVAAELY